MRVKNDDECLDKSVAIEIRVTLYLPDRVSRERGS